MLTIATMTPAKAGSYYKENYYEEEDQEEFSEWWGGGAESLGLSGQIDDAKLFRQVLQGFAPDGRQLRAAPPKGREPRAGTDLTFSAPKSVSIAALVGGDKRLIEAHNQAVDRVLSLIQNRYAETRINKQMQAVDNLCVAKFLHDTNRELEPNLHTHCLVMNIALGADGQWRSATNGNLYHYKMLLGRFYRNELALEAQKLGYEIEPRADGLFELKGYSRIQIEAYSDRHQQILEYLEAQGLEDTTENRVLALFKTRKAKQKNVNREELRALWQGEAKEFSIIHPMPSSTSTLVENNLAERVSQAISHCEERSAIFTTEDLETFIFSSPTGRSIVDIEAEIKTHPRLIVRGSRYATHESLEREKITIALMRDGQGKMPAISSESDLQLPDELTLSQSTAIRQALGSRDRVLGWVGVAGAGKTHTLKNLVDFAKQHGIEVSGFAPDASSAAVLGDEIGIHSNTVAYHLTRDLAPSTQRQLWIIDEAGKLSAQEAYDLLQKSRLYNTQVLFVGDPKQLTAVNAGAPFKSLIENGLSNAKLKDFLRQKAPVIARAVQLTYYNLGGEAIHWLDEHGKISEIQDLDDRAKAISQAYLSLSPVEQTNTLVLSGTHKERFALTRHIRQGLKTQGAVSQEDYQIVILDRKDMTQEQKQHARFYTVGDVLIPLKHHNCLRRSQRFTITKIEGDNLTFDHRITLNLKGLKTPLATEVFTQRQIDIAQGDRLKWTRNHHKLKRYNGREFTVEEIDRVTQTVRVKYTSGRYDEFCLESLNHLDHAIVGTIFSSQGQTADLALIGFGNDPTVNRESVLVALSRARYDTQIWTPNARSLGELADVSNNQVNPSELMKEHGIKLPPPPPPMHIDLKHWLERVEKSAIAPEVASLNAVTLTDWEVLDRLLAQNFEKLGSGQYWTEPMARIRDGAIRVKACNLKTQREFSLWAKCPELGYERLAEGGVWASGGIDATELPKLQPGQKPSLKEFGEFKADNPRLDLQKTQKKGKLEYRKYEAPKDTPKGCSFPEVPDTIAQKIFDRYGVNPTPTERESGFWPCVYWYPQITVIPVEGKKKAEAVISQGYCAIALPSSNGGYRAKEDGVELPKRKLHPELSVFAQSGRSFLIAFDKDENPATVKNVRRDLVRTGELLEEAGSHVSVLNWKPREGKGPDDLIVNQGTTRFKEIVDHASPMQWEADKHYRSEYLRLRNHVFKLYGKDRSPSEMVIDTAIAYHAREQDMLKILGQSNVARQAFRVNNQEKSKTHLDLVRKNYNQLLERLRVEKHQEVAAQQTRKLIPKM
jgi:conjugative relaxase-like TrwC/TraI family protein